MIKATGIYSFQTVSEAKCIQCARCLEVCPVFLATNAEELSPRAKAVMLQNLDLLSRYMTREVRTSDPRLLNKVRMLAGLCAGCGKCARVCPQQVDVPGRLSKIKSECSGWRAWIWARLVKYGFLLPKALPLAATERVLGPFLPAGRRKYLTAISRGETVKPWLKIEMSKVTQGLSREASVAEREDVKKVVVFPGCLGRIFWPHLLEKAEKLLKGLGYQLLPTPDWACCGFTFKGAGLLNEQKRCQEINFALWKKLGQPKIVTFCATCDHGLKDIFDTNFSKFKESIVSFEGLIDYATWTLDGDRPEHILWHRPCHAREGEARLWQEKFESAGVKLTLNEEYCCGLGGSLQIEAPDLSRQVSTLFWQNLDINDGTVHILSSCNGCVLQLKATKPDNMRVSHWLEVIRTE
ncbi:(Fe-S)-binding protein [Desulfohalobiaceae bacterium Ax17]|uniref:(Fe-S)-binding protein n=1 Tax=Desulfovulcanus ferrireducens TaxID=2831190 RepID=UPI00207BCD7E|nr:(Fe-S)-binding protein [Desulfovulcanus ferrireducens]MBT8764466.1 (Fe-S)-binding protein [Desulfovulcanus ferrireducens]